MAVSVLNAENCRRSKNFLSKIDKRIQASTIDASWPQNDIHMRNATQTSSLLPILWGKPVPVHSSELHELPQDNIIGPSLSHLEIASFNDQRYRCSYGGFNRPFNCAPALRRSFVQSCRGLRAAATYHVGDRRCQGALTVVYLRLARELIAVIEST